MWPLPANAHPTSDTIQQLIKSKKSAGRSYTEGQERVRRIRKGSGAEHIVHTLGSKGHGIQWDIYCRLTIGCLSVIPRSNMPHLHVAAKLERHVTSLTPFQPDDGKRSEVLAI